MICNSIESDSIHIGVEIKGAHYYHASAYQDVNLPKFLSEVRKNQPELREKWNLEPYFDDANISSSDSPLFHGATYNEFDVRLSAYGINILSGIIAEHRGISYGVLDKESMIVYPRILLKYDTSFSIFGEPCGAGVSVGTYENLKINEGLTFYNFDAIGCNFYAKWRNLKIEFFRVGDLKRGYGLNIDDSDDWILSAKDIGVYQDWKLDASLDFFNYGAGCRGLFDNANSKNGYSVSAGFHNDNARIYAQYALRGLSEDFVESKYRSAVLFGASYDNKFDKLHIGLAAEYRWYGFYFNLGFINEDVFFRDTIRGNYG